MAQSTAERPEWGIGGLAQQANTAFAVGAVVVPLGALAVTLVSNDVRALTFVHVMAGILWTGIDIFMGAVLGPVVGGLDPKQRADFFGRFTPKMTFLMPALAIVTIAGGITLALKIETFAYADQWLAIFTAVNTVPIVLIIGHQFDALTDWRTLSVLALTAIGSGASLVTTLPGTELAAMVTTTSPWILAALGIVTLLGLQGFGVVLPGEIRIYRQIASENPDTDLIGDIGMRNARLGGVQGVLQLSIVFVMVGLRYLS